MQRILWLWKRINFTCLLVGDTCHMCRMTLKLIPCGMMVPFHFAEFQYPNHKPNPNPNPLTPTLTLCNVEFGELNFGESKFREIEFHELKGHRCDFPFRRFPFRVMVREWNEREGKWKTAKWEMAKSTPGYWYSLSVLISCPFVTLNYSV